MTISAEQQRLYRAYSHWYSKESNLRRKIFVTDVLLAIAGLGLAIWAHSSSPPTLLGQLAAACGLVWLLARELAVRRGASEARRTAVNIQQRFDLSFYGDWEDHWNRLLLGEPAPEHEIRQAHARHRGRDVEDDYWVDTVGLRPEKAAIARSYQTAIWGAGLHGEYAELTMKATWAFAMIIVIALLVSDIGLLTASPAIFAVAPLLVGRTQSAAHHRELESRRNALAKYAKEQIRSPEVRVAAVRLAQDEMARLRLIDRRTPQWLYDKRRQAYKGTHDTSAADLVSSERRASQGGTN